MTCKHHKLKCFSDLPLGVFSDVFDGTDQLKVLSGGQLFIQNIKLLTKAHVLSYIVNFGRDCSVIKNCVTTSRLEHASEHVNCCRLACTVVTQNREDFVVFDAQSQVVNRGEVASELFGQS